MRLKNILTFDVEDNFTREELVFKHDWEKYEGQVVENTRMILAFLEKHGATATFFVLGKVAERHPEVVRMVAAAKHEIASHGYVHEMVHILGKEGFAEDVRRSKTLLESLSGQTVEGFRARAFSITAETMWALDSLRSYGFRYDSSILSCNFVESLERDGCSFPDERLSEFPIATLSIAGRQFTVGGGVFFRLAPYRIVERAIEKENSEGRPVVLYAHAWEFNRDQPRRKVGLFQSVAQSPLTFNTSRRLSRLSEKSSFTSIKECLAGL